MEFGGVVQLLVLVLNFMFTVILCYLYDLNNWITDDKSTQLTKNTFQYEGFWRICTSVKGGGTSCEKYDEWVFSPKFPSWILAGRILIGLAIFIGYASCLGLLLGSSIATVVDQKGTKKILRLVSSAGIVVAGACTMATGLFVFFMKYSEHADQAWVHRQSNAITHTALIPTTCTYVSIFMGIFWIIAGLLGFCCRGEEKDNGGMEMYAHSRGHGYA